MARTARQVVGAGLVLGPFAGGLLLEHAGGRSPFACAAVLGSLALLALLCFVPVAWRAESVDLEWNLGQNAARSTCRPPSALPRRLPCPYSQPCGCWPAAPFWPGMLLPRDWLLG